MRPRNATCGRAEPAISMSSEATAATSTPLRMPSSNTPTSATIEILNSDRLIRQRCLSALTSISPRTATSTIEASTTVGKLLRVPVRNSKQAASVADAKSRLSGVCAPSLIVYG